jgi:tight adherence protein C
MMQENFSDPLIQLLLFVLIAGLALIGLLLRSNQQRNPLTSRLRDVAPPDSIVIGASDSITSEFAALPAWLQHVADFGEQLAGTEQDRSKLQRLLNTAGLRRPQALGLMSAAKYGCGLLLIVLMLWGVLDASSRFGLTGLALGLIALFVGTTLPELYLKVRAGRRHESLSRSMPDALDLMIICAEVGLPFPRILKVVSRELSLSAPAMADELAYTSAELQLLPDRAQALRHLAERTSVAAIESMVGSLIQAERYGTPLAQALRTIADESRSTLILTLEEKAGKLPAQLSLPLMTLILPPVVALVATPALVRVIRSLM